MLDIASWVARVAGLAWWAIEAGGAAGRACAVCVCLKRARQAERSPPTHPPLRPTRCLLRLLSTELPFWLLASPSSTSRPNLTNHSKVVAGRIPPSIPGAGFREPS